MQKEADGNNAVRAPENWSSVSEKVGNNPNMNKD
jgi:hypothetical protein